MGSRLNYEHSTPNRQTLSTNENNNYVKESHPKSVNEEMESIKAIWACPE